MPLIQTRSQLIRFFFPVVSFSQQLITSISGRQTTFSPLAPFSTRGLSSPAAWASLPNAHLIRTPEKHTKTPYGLFKQLLPTKVARRHVRLCKEWRLVRALAGDRISQKADRGDGRRKTGGGGEDGKLRKAEEKKRECPICQGYQLRPDTGRETRGRIAHVEARAGSTPRQSGQGFQPTSEQKSQNS